jgi:GTPase SAR1 family protein
MTLSKEKKSMMVIMSECTFNMSREIRSMQKETNRHFGAHQRTSHETEDKSPTQWKILQILRVK